MPSRRVHGGYERRVRICRWDKQPVLVRLAQPTARSPDRGTVGYWPGPMVRSKGMPGFAVSAISWFSAGATGSPVAARDTPEADLIRPVGLPPGLGRLSQKGSGVE